HVFFLSFWLAKKAAFGRMRLAAGTDSVVTNSLNSFSGIVTPFKIIGNHPHYRKRPHARASAPSHRPRNGGEKNCATAKGSLANHATTCILRRSFSQAKKNLWKFGTSRLLPMSTMGKRPLWMVS